MFTPFWLQVWPPFLCLFTFLVPIWMAEKVPSFLYFSLQLQIKFINKTEIRNSSQLIWSLHVAWFNSLLSSEWAWIPGCRAISVPLKENFLCFLFPPAILMASFFVDIEDELQICRICFEPETSYDEVISPCNCAGSQKFVHQRCLSKWQATGK